MNTLLEDTCPPQVIPILFVGNLLALKKKSGGIRPIAVGYVWRRLAAKCTNSSATTKLVDYFSRTQLGVGIPGGCAAAVHATRRFIEFMPNGFVVAKLDFANAFNILHRDAMLQAVADKVLEIYKFCYLSYQQSSILQFNRFKLLSNEGPQHGDPLGPFPFCLTIHAHLT